MNRRAFLSALAGAFVADPEKALWVPGKKLISIPKPKVLAFPPFPLPQGYIDMAMEQLQPRMVFRPLQSARNLAITIDNEVIRTIQPRLF